MKGLLLFILSIVSLLLVSPISIIYGFFKGKLDFMSYAISVDQMINLLAGHLFSDLMLVDPNLFPFGDMDKTISFNIGKNGLFG